MQAKVDPLRFYRNLIDTNLFHQEKKSLIPPSQRMLLCILLREFRLMTRSLKPLVSLAFFSFSHSLQPYSAQWLPTTVQWFDDFCANEHLGELDQEVTESVQRVQGLYMAGQAGVQQIYKVRVI